MTIIKTPQQVASAAVNDSTAPEEWSGDTLAQVRLFVIDAIEADRAQRSNIHPDYRDDQQNVQDAHHVDVAWAAYDSLGEVTFESNARLTAAEAVGMFQGIGEAAVLEPQPEPIYTTPSPIERVTTWADGFGRWHSSVVFAHTLSESDARPEFNLQAQIPKIRRAARRAILDQLVLREQKSSKSARQTRAQLKRILRLEISEQDIDALNRWHGITYREKE